MNMAEAVYLLLMKESWDGCLLSNKNSTHLWVETDEQIETSS